MYTSGSTGRPKGVKVKQAGVLNMTRAQITCWGIVCEDVIVQFASIGFDASVSEIFTALLSGASVAILDGSERHGRRFISAMNQMQVTVITLPPSALNIYSPSDLPLLRIVVAAGEVCTSNIATKWTFARNVSFFNAYGPTECTVCTTMYKFYLDALQEEFNYDLPIGRAIDGVRVFLFDNFMNPIPPGVVGEIYIGGHGVSNGYIGHARHLTQERFVQSPLTNVPYPLYKSGDLGFQDLKGTVTFVGRIDEQVKLRGHRIDLGEIEQVLIQFDKVESAIAVVHMCSVARDLSIAAFVSPKCLDVYDLREYAVKALPKYMIPTFFKQIDVKELPLTINGKIDRKRLQQDESIHEMIGEKGDNYLDETQQKIAKHWCRIFSLDDSFLKKMQKKTSFSQLGGNSLQLVLLLRHIEEDCNVAIPFAEFAFLDTLEEFADAFQQKINESKQILPCNTDQKCELRKNIYQDSQLNSHFHHVNTASVMQEHKSSLYHQNKGIKHTKKILISGVTGFLGAFLVSEILQQSDFLVFCMIRGTTEHKGMDRLVSNMNFYGLWESDYQSRIRVVLSDNSKENLGIEQEKYEFLCREIEVVFMNAAQMNFNMSYDYHRAVNVRSTKEFIKLATKGRQKYLFFTSSLSVFLFPSKEESKNGTRNTFLESDIFDDPILLKTGYGQSKWACERLVFQALYSLPGGAIFRPARISGRSTDGVGPTNDLFARTVLGIKKLGSYPCIDFPYDLIPVDFCAKSMIEIAIKQSDFDEGTNEIVYHLYNKDTIPFRNLFDGLGLKCLPLDDWRMELKHADADNELVPLTPFFMSEFWEHAPYWPIFDTNNLDNAVSESAKQLLKPASELWQIYKRFFVVNMESMNEVSVTVREATSDDAKVLIEFTAGEGWDYTEYDYRAYKAVDPDFLLVAVDNTGFPVGFGGICKMAPGTMYLGSYIVRKCLRGRGIGRQIWRALLQRAGDRNICLDGVADKVGWYRKQGFVFETFKVRFCTVKITSDMQGPLDTVYEIRPLSKNLWPAVLAYDKQIYPSIDREKILRAWFTGSGTEAVVAIKEGSVVGYGSIHIKSENNYGIRNVFANSENVVEAILKYLFAKLQSGSTVHFMLLDGKPLPEYLKGCIMSNEMAHRMYNKTEIETITEKIWLPTAHII